jgi:hypothetical protein
VQKIEDPSSVINLHNNSGNVVNVELERRAFIHPLHQAKASYRRGILGGKQQELVIRHFCCSNVNRCVQADETECWFNPCLKCSEMQ